LIHVILILSRVCAHLCTPSRWTSKYDEKGITCVQGRRKIHEMRRQ
jgi:hypothetical protein